MEENEYIEIGKILSGELKQNLPAEARDLEKIWAQAGDFKYAEAAENDLAWNKLKSKIQEPAPLKISWLRKNAWAVAASVSLLLIAGGGIWIFNNHNEPLIAAIEESTTNREMKTMHLSDGSTIVLNSNTKITVEAGFNQKSRKIKLVGEANFEVAPNAKIPFEVYAGNTKTLVVGTGFDISAFDGEDVAIAVNHGKVKFGNPKSSVYITKGEAARSIGNGNQLIKEVLNPNQLAWQQDNWIFKAARLDEIALQMKHRFGKTFKYNANDAAKQFTGKFAQGTSIESMAKTIAEALQVQITIE
jgi:ferric-dicitrate binding protein FerR (iron transport regulator)